MKCNAVNKLLAAYLDKELKPEEEEQVQSHLSTCQHCQEELKIFRTTQEQLREALTARAASASPSPQAWGRLEQRLEVTSSLTFWERWGNILRNPVWSAVTAAILVVALALSVLWGTGVFTGVRQASAPAFAPESAQKNLTGLPTPSPTPVPPVPTPTPSPAPRPAPPPPFMANVVPEETSYLPGEKIAARLSLTNTSAEVISISSYPPQVQVTPRFNPDQVLFALAGGAQSLDIKPKDTMTFDFTWEQKDSEGKQVPPGWYNIIFYDMNVSQGGNRITMNPVARVLIQYPQGVMQKNFDVNQSQTVNGVTVTLQRIELTSAGMKVYAFNTPPGYSFPSGQPLPAPTMMFTGNAEYSVDGGVFKEAGSSGIRPLENGMQHIWENLDPVPSDARELVFRVTKLGDWQGSWEFKILLQ